MGEDAVSHLFFEAMAIGSLWLRIIASTFPH